MYFFCLLAVLAGHEAMGSLSVSPSEEVQLNFQQLIETNSCPGCNLSGAVLNRIDLSGANLEGANLAGTQLYLANLAGANLQNANLQGAALGGADLAGADLRGANLTGAIIEGAYLKDARMDGTVIIKRPYLDEGGPGVGEKVYVDDETNSKHLPFTDRAYVAGQEEETAGMTGEQAEIDSGESEEEQPGLGTGAETAQGETTPQNDQAELQEPLSADSKKLVMMADAVVPQDTPEDVAEKPAAAQGPGRIAQAEQLPDRVKTGTMAETSSNEQSGKMQEAEQDLPVVVTAEDHQEPAPEPAIDQENNEDVESALEPPVEMEAEHAAQESPVMQQAPDSLPENSTAAADDRSRQVILDRDTVVAEAVSPDVSDFPQEMAAEAQQAPAEAPVAPEIFQETVSKSAAGQPQDTEMKDATPEEVAGPVGQELEPVASGPEPAETDLAEQIPEPEGVSEKTAESIDAAKKALVERLLDENRCVGCDLSGVDLSGRDLDEADLERAVLQGANLSNADLSEANLKGADLRGANLRNADLREADLYRANLGDADLTGARFEKALMDLVMSSGAIGADFTGALSDE